VRLALTIVLAKQESCFLGPADASSESLKAMGAMLAVTGILGMAAYSVSKRHR
jgi:hypothetical protein